jgi:hypothetical protein
MPLTIIALPDSSPERQPLARVIRRRLWPDFLTRPAAFGRYGGLCRECHRSVTRPEPMPVPAAMRCRHCDRGRRCGSRRLCWHCYELPAIRDLYPPTHECARRGVGNGNRNACLPAEPTSALPGSEEKVLVMIERAERRESLFHPRDGTR